MPDLTETQVRFRAEVARFAATEIAPHAQEWDETGEFPKHLFGKLGELGWLGVGLPPEAGGSGGGATDRCVLIEELARASAGVALGIYVHFALAASAIAIVGSGELAEKYVPAMLAGEATGAWAYAEPDSGADVTRVRLSAREDGDHYVLNGSKLYITNATFADVLVVVARTSGEPGSLKGISVFVVPGDSAGMERRPMRKVGMRASELGELHFTDCLVPRDHLVGQPDNGFRQCLPVLSQGRVFGGALAVGLGSAALEQAVRHVSTREQFGGPLTDLQGVRFTIADMATRLRAARSLVYSAAAKLDSGQAYDAEASIAKLFASQTTTWLAERAMHLHGAQGFMMDSPVQRFYRDCKILEYGEGANEVQREMIFKSVAGGFRP
ncbi:MAG: acyl-CoA dehydrogenase family protein [Candidatus Nanopelagicales bacterium]|nr:acyl-CoA dehydrogenase family protein [Candidatus Nanopelagicales bacterium]MDZ4249972.1 acyl-CoA dehydrogenase family protein [Candidatus Nanopelagicales bacterium]